MPGKNRDKSTPSLELVESTGAVRINGRTIRLRPKTHAVLELFLQSPNTLLDKKHIIDKVWGNTVVTEDSLTQCIGELRRALADDSRSIIETVPRRGFIFHMPKGDESSLRQDSRLAKWFVWIAGLATITGAIVVAGLVQQRSPEVAEHEEFIAVASIASPQDSVVSSARLLSEALRLRLDEVATLSVRSVGAWAPTGLTAQDLEPVSATGANWLVSGEILEVEGAEANRVQIWLWNVSTSNRYSLGVFSLPLNSDAESTLDFVALRDLVIERVLDRMPGHALGNDVASFPSTLRDFEVYAYVMVELEKERCDPELAERMRPVVANTPGFARGWMALAWTHWVEYWACGTGSESLDEAIAAAEQVLKLQPNDPLAIKVKTSALAARGEVAEALRVAELAANASPEDAALWSTVSYLRNYSGDLTLSREAMDRALEIDPLVLVAETGETPNVYIYVNDWQMYLEAQPPFDSPFFNFQRAYALYRLGDTESAVRIAADTRQRFPADLYSRFCSVLMAIIEGRLEVAENILVGIMEERDSSGQTDGEVAYREAILLALSGSTDRAISRLRTAFRQNFVCLECVQRDSAWSVARDSAPFREWLDEQNAIR